jgi:hypothetical protein
LSLLHRQQIKLTVKLTPFVATGELFPLPAQGTSSQQELKDGKTRSIAFLPSFLLSGKESNYLRFLSCIL